MILHRPPSKALPNKLFKEVLDRKQSRRDILITHSARTVTFVGGLGRSLGHVVSNHVVSWAKGGGKMAKFHVLAQHVYTHVDVPRGRLVCGMEPHSDGAFVVNKDVSTNVTVRTVEGIFYRKVTHEMGEPKAAPLTL